MSEPTFTAFVGERQLASGVVKEVVSAARRQQARGDEEGLLIFEDETGRQVDFDLRGSEEEVLARLQTHPLVGDKRPGPGRPKLGVVSREVTLLPRHWEWLEEQPSGISAALRRLVEEARKRDPDASRQRQVRDAASRVMTALAGNRPGYEEASRALFANDLERFKELIRPWPTGVKRYLLQRLGSPT